MRGSGAGTSLEGRRWLTIGGAAACTLLLATILGLFVLYPYLGERKIRRVLTGKLAARIGRPVSVGDVDVSLGRAVIRDIEVSGADGEPMLHVPEVVARFGVGASLFGRLELERVSVREPEVLVAVARDGTSNWDAAIDWLHHRRAKEHAGGSGGLRPDRAVVEGARVELRDRGVGLTAVASDIDGEVAGGKVALDIGTVAVSSGLGPRADLHHLAVRASTGDLGGTAELRVGDGELKLWPGMRLTGVAGTVRPGERADQLWLDLSGSWGGATEKLWKARGYLGADRTGKIELVAERFSLGRLAGVLEGTPLRDYADTQVGVDVTLTSDGTQVQVAGHVDIADLDIYHPKLASDVIRDVSLRGELDATYDMEARELAVESATLHSGGAEYHLTGGLRLGEDRLLDSVKARLVIPPIDCQKMLESIPAALVPNLQGFQLSGTFDTDVALQIGWDDLESTVLDGHVGIRRCRVRHANREMSAKKIMGEFENDALMRFDDDGEPVYETITIGPSNPDFVPFEEVSPYLINSLLTTEDSSFFRHHGFISSEFRTALVKDLEAGYFRYGASSITMQLVKNVYLDREKTLSRKLQELFMAWYIETKVPKERLMEVYVNAIEYGPGLYGIGPAARRYFGKPAAELNPVEAAFFSSILPAPRRRFKQYCRDRLSSWAQRKIQRILQTMRKRDRLTDEELAQAQVTPLVFNPEKEGCRGIRRSRWRRSPGRDRR